MDETCAQCKKDFNEDKIIGCEGSCLRWFHIECVNITRKQVEVLETLKSAKWFCRVCYQQSGTNEVQNNIIKSLKLLEEKVEKLVPCFKPTPDEPEAGSSIEPRKTTYASVAKKTNTVKEILVVRNKDTIGLEADKIKEKLKEQINPVDLGIGVTNIRNFTKNGVSIGCESLGDKNKLREELERKMGKEFIIQEALVPAKKFKIIGVDNNLTKEEIAEAILKQNQLELDLKILKVTKITDHSSMVILEVARGVEQISGMNKLKIQWRICKISGFDSVYRCFNCYGYNHKAANCTNPAICSKCGENKHDEDCVDIKTCQNCIKANEKFNMSVDVNHSMFDSSKCKIYQLEIEKQKNRIVLKD